MECPGNIGWVPPRSRSWPYPPLLWEKGMETESTTATTMIGIVIGTTTLTMIATTCEGGITTTIATTTSRPA